MKGKYYRILALSCFLFLGCGGPVDPEVEFTPPSWIIGIWHDGTDFNNFTFSSDNVVLDSPAASTSINFKVAYSSATVTEDVNSDSEYKFTITSTGVNQTYQFVKASVTTLNHSLTTSGVTFGPLLLTKQ